MNVAIDTTGQTSLPGFGDHSQLVNYTQYAKAKKIARIAFAIFSMTALISGMFLLSNYFAIAPIVQIPLRKILAISGAALSVTSLTTLLASLHLFRQKHAYFGSTNEINAKITSPPVGLGEFSTCQGIPLSDAMESFKWKKKLIESAESNIVLSGNYCGGNSFDEVLELLDKQISNKPNLKVVILTSSEHLTQKNYEAIDILNKKFKDRFQTIITSIALHVNPGVKQMSNHSKFLVVDYGNYFLLGGSGIEDRYTYTIGLEEGHTTQVKQSISSYFLPAKFRDQDFVFSSSQNEVGRRLYIEGLKLGMRWNGINQKTGLNDANGNVVNQFSSVLHSLLIAETAHIDESMRPFHPIPEFDCHPSLLSNVQTKILCTGPELAKNAFEEELFERIQNAKERIVIDHMYFHPTEKLLCALVEAVKRGVKIKIVTNGVKDTSPNSHQFFVPRSQYNYYVLAQRLGKTHRDNLEIFESAADHTTLHKKVFVVDDYVISGSSNFGYKSLVTMSDHEVNFVTKNQEFADETVRIIDTDIYETPSSLDGFVFNEATHPKPNLRSYVKRILNPEKRPSIAKICTAAFHRILAPIIG